ncbi:MAG: 16S rRNA (uracil(1498)-N(3))-methyltransferase [Lentisphaerae bacterium]|nr:16S rRNA (uracil(1498)-N(3))-methyltransferase [Lentisphaerota bacterium]
MHRFLVERSRWNPPEFTLGPDETHHLLKVLRLKPGDSVELLDGMGRTVQAEVPSVIPGGKRPELVIRSDDMRVEPPPRTELVLVQALIKGPRMDWIIEKATELGVGRILVYCGDRSVGRPSDLESASRIERWSRVALSAVKQCGGPFLPHIEAIGDAAAAAQAVALLDCAFTGSLSRGCRPLRDAARDAGAGVRSAGLVIGPEGDLTPDELARFSVAGAVETSFGRRVLRAETAAVFGLSVLASEFDGPSGP